VTFAGRGIADVVTSLADLGKAVSGGGGIPSAVTHGRTYDFTPSYGAGAVPAPFVIPNYAEIQVYEPVLTGPGCVEWRRIVDQAFTRHVVSIAQRMQESTHITPLVPTLAPPPATYSPGFLVPLPPAQVPIAPAPASPSKPVSQAIEQG